MPSMMPFFGTGISAAALSIVSSGLVGYWDAGNTASYPGFGTTWTDLSSSGLNITLNAQPMPSSGPSNFFGPASTPTTSILNTDTHSIFFMLRFDTNGSYPNHYNGVWSQIFSFAPSGTDRSPAIWRYENSRRLHWRYDPNNGGVEIAFDTARFDTSWPGTLLGGTEFPTNTWFYVGVTKNGATASAYVNGSSLGSGTITNPKTAGSSAITLFNGFVPPARLNALTIYNRAISASEVTQNYNALRGRFGL